jgi:regulator of sigma E protease
MFLSIITFIVILSILVLVHEFGHFVVARRNGVWVEEFGIGYPPRVWGKKIGETLYSVNLLPLGGFVRLHGEQTDEGVTKPEQAFINKSKKVRFAILSAGVVMNFLLAIVCFAVFYGFSGVPRETDKVIVSGVVKGAPADVVGIMPSDIVMSVDGIDLKSIDDFSGMIKERVGKEVTLEILSEKESSVKSIKITPRVDIPENEGPLGILITQTEIYFPPIWQRPFLGIYFGFKDAIFWGQQVLIGLYTMVSNLIGGQVPKDIVGPVGIYAMTSEIAKVGILPLINFLGIFSVNLAVINFLPIPALDGGRFFFIVIEKIFGRKIIPKVEAAIHGAGMVVLLSLFAFLTFVEVKRLITAGSLQGFLESTMK